MNAAAHRSRAIVLAVLTSLLSKGGNVLLMLLALPLAIRTLGPERAAIFGMLQSMMFFIYMADPGIGPGMVRRIAQAHAAGDRGHVQRVISTGFFTVLAITACGAACGAVLLALVPVTALFGHGFAPHAGELSQCAWAGLGLFSLLMLLWILDRVREGLQEVHVSNAFGAVMNVTAAALLWLGLARFPSVMFVVLAVWGVAALFLIANVISMMAGRPWLVPRPAGVDRPLARRMLAEGIALFVAGGAAPVIEREGLKLLLGHMGTPLQVTEYVILSQLGLFALGFIVMFSRPLLPALADAVGRDDAAWVQSVRRRIQRFALPAGILITAGFYFLGPPVAGLWLGRQDFVDRSECGWFGLWLALMIWAHLHFVMLASLKQARPAALIMAVEAALVLALAAAGIRIGGVTGGLIGACLGTVVMSGWQLPLVLQRVLRRPPAAT